MHMEEDDDGSSRRSLLVNISSLLYCNEDPLGGSTPPPSAAAAAADDDYRSSSSRRSCSCSALPQPVVSSVVDEAAAVAAAEEEELQELLLEHMARQGSYAPRGDYLEHLQPQEASAAAAAAIPEDHGGVSAARSRGVHYIIYAFGRLGLEAATVFNAVNYLDRFLSINCHLRWEAWMVELVSVACLSVACKLDEVNVPSLHHLQMEEVMSHSFLPATVRDMELTLLKALQWRLACVTPYSFLQLLLPLARATATSQASRCTRLLIRSLAEPSLLLRFDSSTIAASALRCVAMQQQQQHQHYLQLQDNHQTVFVPSSYINRLLIRPSADDCQTEDNDADDECFKMMQALYATCCLDHLNTHHHHYHFYSTKMQRSPVIDPFPTDRATTTFISRSAVSRRLFGGSTHQGRTTTTTTQDKEEDESTPN